MPEWLAESNLEMSENFISVNYHLQSLNFKIHLLLETQLLLKILRDPNLSYGSQTGRDIKRKSISLLIKKPLKKFKPQKNWLYLIGTHKNSAVLNYFNFSFEGNWCWLLKKIIDLNFMKKFSFPEQTDMRKKNS